MKIYFSDLARAKMCSKGTRKFFAEHELDFQDFLKNGIDEHLLLNTNDAMAKRLVEVARNGRKE